MAEGYDPPTARGPCGAPSSGWSRIPLALKLLAGDFLAGETVIVVDIDGTTGKLRFEKQLETVAA